MAVCIAGKHLLDTQGAGQCRRCPVIVGPQLIRGYRDLADIQVVSADRQACTRWVRREVTHLPQRGECLIARAETGIAGQRIAQRRGLCRLHVRPLGETLQGCLQRRAWSGAAHGWCFS